MVQLAPAANDPAVGHVVDGSNAYSLLDSASELIVSALVWLFVRATVFVVLVVLTTTMPKLSDVADRVVAATPTPDRLSDWGLVEASSTTVRVPGVCVPTVVGAKVTPMEQLPPDGTGVPTLHVVAAGARVKAVPVTLIEERFRLADP
jgi:hypothetical protein